MTNDLSNLKNLLSEILANSTASYNFQDAGTQTPPIIKIKKIADFEEKEKPSRKTLEDYKLDLENLKNREFASKITDRQKLTKSVTKIITGWLVFVGFVVLLNGLSLHNPFPIKYHIGLHFNLSENIMLALLGTTTANILGLFLIVIKYFFNNDDTKK